MTTRWRTSMVASALRRHVPLSRAKRNKYGVDISPTGKLLRQHRGVQYDSGLEAKYAARLDMLKAVIGPARDRVVSWRRQVPVNLEVNGQWVTTLIVDFEVQFADGRVELVELKGVDTPTWRLKHRLYRALFPQRPLKVVREVT